MEFENVVKNHRFDVQGETQSLIGSEIVQAATHKNMCECASTLKQNVFSSEMNIESISWTEMVQPQSFFYLSPCQKIESILHDITFKNRRMSIKLKLQNLVCTNGVVFAMYHIFFFAKSGLHKNLLLKHVFCIRDVSTLGFSISDRRESH